jgi:TyrR family helix-turn-helix protein/PAS domain S-box-containing protein
MDNNFKLNLLFRDRLGIVADISAVFARSGFNIVTMEVEKIDHQADVYLEVERDPDGLNREEAIEALKTIPDLVSIRLVNTLPRERREKVFRFVLDNVSDGIVSIDMDGRITSINQVAREIMNCEGRDVEGARITDLTFADTDILDCLNGKTFVNEKRNLMTDKGRMRFFATGKPIVGSGGRMMGAVEIMKDMKEIRSLAQEVSQPVHVSFSDFIGRSPSIREAISFAQKIARTDTVVSVRGDSGTGKELFARAIHAESGREGPFIAINCAALPESLLESELFGYADGAFTGAKKGGAPGLFELAVGGTILLDEIADLPPGPQAKLLRVIQEKSVRRVGGKTEIPVNTRIITATNRNLEHMVEDKSFRQDLYYRINVLPVHLPPLAERIEDIPLLVDHFLFQLTTRLDKPAQRVAPQALEKLRGHDWPGNVRELRNVIERAAILSDGDEIREDAILFSFEVGRRGRTVEVPIPAAPAAEGALKDIMAEYEKQILTDALSLGYSIRGTARMLGVSHTALMNKMYKYGLKTA